MRTIVNITGSTYAIRDQIRALGGRWNSAKRQWELPKDKAEAARKLLFPLGTIKYDPADYPVAY